MKQFMMIFRNRTDNSAENFSSEQMQTSLKEWQNWIADIASQGKYLGTNRLFPEGKMINKGTISDGSYGEGNVSVSGYLLIQANSFDEALDMAKLCPNLVYGLNVEVRSVIPIEYNIISGKFLDIK
jgi:hypothetical protein